MSESLWGDLPEADEIIHPKTVLAEQATHLSTATGGALHAEVEVERHKSIHFIGDFLVRFTIVCPSLQNYRYEVIRVYYSLTEVYPTEVVNVPEGEYKIIRASNAESFKNTVKTILQSSKVRTAVAALLRDAGDRAYP